MGSPPFVEDASRERDAESEEHQHGEQEHDQEHEQSGPERAAVHHRKEA